ncbi:MAG: hypothetical protein ABR553_07025, partial [Gammaproteobacteria bacterium]
MNSTTSYYENASISLAAYSELYAGMSIAAFEDALKQNGKGMSAAQAAEFASNWRVVNQCKDSTNGFSATVFESLASGERYLAVRGTEPNDP